jgi:cytochrome c biogenesis protein CcdA
MAVQGEPVARADVSRPSRRWDVILLTGSVVGLVLLATGGWYVWNAYTLPSLSTVSFDSPGALLVFGFLAGGGAFFAPCAFSLFPGYVSYYLAAAGEGNPGRPSWGMGPIGLGLTCGSGALAFFLLIGAVLSIIAAPIAPYLIKAKPFLALAIVLLGVVFLLDRPIPFSWPGRLAGRPSLKGGGERRKVSPSLGVFLYGFGYGLASTGCTLPVYVSVIVLPLTSGLPGAALLTFIGFGVSVSLLMLVTTLLVGFSRQALVERLRASVAWVRRASGIVLILAGLYQGYYFLIAGM